MDRTGLEPGLTIPVQVEYRVEEVTIPSQPCAAVDPGTGELTGETKHTEPVHGWRVVAYWHYDDGTVGTQNDASYSVWPSPVVAASYAESMVEMTRNYFEQLKRDTLA